jgi:hypothetical protein
MTGASGQFPNLRDFCQRALKRFNSREMNGAWQTKKPRLTGGDEPRFGGTPEGGRRKINAF